MVDTSPLARRDLEFFPVQHGGQQLILIRDPLGLVAEGKAVALPLYELMSLMDGTRTVREMQLELMRQKGGVLVGTDEIMGALSLLDESFLLDSERFRRARDEIVRAFTSKKVRPCAHCGHAYPEDPEALRRRLDEILASQSPIPQINERIKALVAPHIDLSAGSRVYSSAFQVLGRTSPYRVVLLGVGHHLVKDLFCLTRKDFETPLGVARCGFPD